MEPDVGEQAGIAAPLGFSSSFQLVSLKILMSSLLPLTLAASHCCETVQGEFPAQPWVILSEPSFRRKSHLTCLYCGVVLFCFTFPFLRAYLWL